MNRSSPVNVTPACVCAPPAVTANAARYRPTGQPSVRRTSSSQVRVVELDARLLESAAASSCPIARSSAPISTMPPCARRRAAGKRQRVARADRELRPGRHAQSELRRWRRGTAGCVTDSKWSMTRATGRRIAAMAETSRRGTSIPAPDDASARNTLGSIGSMRSSADRDVGEKDAPDRCRGHRSRPMPPGVACARPTAPAASSCRSRVGRRRRSPAGRVSEQPVDQSGAGNDPGATVGAWSFDSERSNGGSAAAGGQAWRSSAICPKRALPRDDRNVPLHPCAARPGPEGSSTRQASWSQHGPHDVNALAVVELTSSCRS